tara:strand:- start:2924 stop:4858 length:1935 start_codon:yes stop_codon:yes gene_type:complete
MIQEPLFRPDSEWVPPLEFPDLSEHKQICIDLETQDPHLKERGSGWPRNDGKVVGIAVATDQDAYYFPIGHQSGGNLDAGVVWKWLKSQMKHPSDKVFHNAQYDLGWLRKSGVREINGRIIDTLIAAPLIDENRMSYALNSLGKTYLKERKDEKLLQEAAKQWGINAKSDLWRLPPQYVGPYAEQDARLTLRLWNHFKTIIIQENLKDIFQLEMELLPCLLDMREKGVPVDLRKAEILKKDLERREGKIIKEIKRQYGVEVEIWAAASVAKAFEAAGLSYERTPKSNQPKFDKASLWEKDHPLPRMILEARELNKAHTTFIDTLLQHETKGRIHSEIHQLRSEQGGTVSGRMSYSNPNLQQVPARNKEIGPLIRSLFIPEEDCVWGVFDYSQQEPRLVVHYASVLNYESVAPVLNSYNKDEVDFHQIVADMANIPRSHAKLINLGLFYGMGKKKLAEQLGLDWNESETLFNKYHSHVPFVRQLMNYTSQRANEVGSIKTIGGRKCRFNMWEPDTKGFHKAMPFDQANKEYGKHMALKRAFTYKALNRLIQGSAADQTKAAMVLLYKEGIIPHIQVHDELDISVHDQQQADRIVEIMESSISLKVPNKVDAEYGANWGEAKTTFSEKPLTRGLSGNHSVQLVNED